MLCRSWKLGALAVGACIGLAGAASAGDDTVRLDAKKSTASLIGSLDSTSAFSHADRAKASSDDDDLEDVHFRYRLGYSRGYYGGSYFFPRFYAFRRGYWNGYYGGGYYGGFYPRYYGGNYAPSYAYYSAPLYYSAPTIRTYYSDPCFCSIGGTIAPAVALTAARPALSDPEPPTAPPREYPYDGPSQAKTPSHRYDGGPAKSAPMPNAPAPKMKDPTRINPADGRIVKMPPPAKKYSFAAYGEERMKDRDAGTFVVKGKN